MHLVYNSQAKVGVQRLGYDMVFPLQYGVAGYATLQYGVALEVSVQAGVTSGNGGIHSVFERQPDSTLHSIALKPEIAQSDFIAASTGDSIPCAPLALF